MSDFPKMVQDLLDPAAFPRHPQRVRLVQTHISYVFLTGERAYKIKRPVDFGFLDFSTLERRRHFCHREVELNRRLAPDIYLGVVKVKEYEGRFAIGGRGTVVDYAVVMLELPQERMMREMLLRGEVKASDVEALGKLVADFHARADASEEVARLGGIEAVRQNTEENFLQTEKYVDITVTRKQWQAISSYTRAFLEEQEPLFQQRADQGRIRDCHGDLHSAQIWLLEDGPRILDCIEFNDRFRYSDVAAEVAFLAMDLELHGRRDLSKAFVQAYITASGDEGILALLPFLQCYRAYVRGKVESFKLDDPHIAPQEKAAAREAARAYFALSHSYAHTPRPVLMITAGLTGTGKSTVAAELGSRLDWPVMSSDVVRKALAGIPATQPAYEPYRQGIYSQEFTARTYQELFRRAEIELKGGRSAIIDATFATEDLRQKARALAISYGARFIIVECLTPEGVVKQRLERRIQEGDSTSDGRWEIYLSQRQHYQPIGPAPDTEHIPVDTSQGLEGNLRHVWLQILKGE